MQSTFRSRLKSYHTFALGFWSRVSSDDMLCCKKARIAGQRRGGEPRWAVERPSASSPRRTSRADGAICVGELVQIDGSEHAWFEDRGAPCTLLAFVDDATSCSGATRPGVFRLLRGLQDGATSLFSEQHHPWQNEVYG
jgi:hypothetical protein